MRTISTKSGKSSILLSCNPGLSLRSLEDPYFETPASETLNPINPISPVNLLINPKTPLNPMINPINHKTPIVNPKNPTNPMTPE